MRFAPMPDEHASRSEWAGGIRITMFHNTISWYVEVLEKVCIDFAGETKWNKMLQKCKSK